MTIRLQLVCCAAKTQSFRVWNVMLLNQKTRGFILLHHVQTKVRKIPIDRLTKKKLAKIYKSFSGNSILFDILFRNSGGSRGHGLK